jgi:hypothetical protein
MLVAAGCGPAKPTAAGSQATNTADLPNSSQLSGEGPGQLPPTEATPVLSENEMAVLLNELTQVVRKFGMEQRRAPKSIDELVSAGYLSHLPGAPAGKRFAIDQKLKVYLADE